MNTLQALLCLHVTSVSYIESTRNPLLADNISSDMIIFRNSNLIERVNKISAWCDILYP